MLNLARRIHAFTLLLVAVSCLPACGDDASSGSDAGKSDAGKSAAGKDAGKNDAAAASADSGPPAGNDAGPGMAVDAAVSGSPVFPSGKGYAVAYLAGDGIGIDQRPDCTAKFDAQGLTFYQASTMEKLAIGTCSQRSAGHNDEGAWGTWIDGKATGLYYASTFKTFDTIDNVFHYATGARTTAAKAPTGTVTYELSGGSAPTRAGDSAPGRLSAATLTINFAAKTVAITLKVKMSDGTITRSGTGGTFNGTSFFGNDINVRGFVVGPNGEGAVIVYMVDSASSDDAGSPIQITGSAGFER